MGFRVNVSKQGVSIEPGEPDGGKMHERMILALDGGYGLTRGELDGLSHQMVTDVQWIQVRNACR